LKLKILNFAIIQVRGIPCGFYSFFGNELILFSDPQDGFHISGMRLTYMFHD